jgi:N-acetylglucosaminyldiphosphoundecaprenol N-acetyl-beta-D-mannosaminyltransferase
MASIKSQSPSLTHPVLNQRVSVISLDLSVGAYDQLLDCVIQAAHQHTPRSVCFANVHMVMEARRSPSIAKAVNGADWVVPDGVPLLWAMRGLHKLHQERIAGMDATSSLLSRAATEGISVFFFGSTPDVLEQVQRLCLEMHPSLRIAGMVSPPFRPATPEEDEDTIRTITASGAGLVFVALGCPKQELWMARMRGRIPAVLLGVGGALPVLAGHQARAPHWIQRAGIEWLFRLVQEPRRLFKRYALTNSLYVYYILQHLVRQRTKSAAETADIN